VSSGSARRAAIAVFAGLLAFSSTAAAQSPLAPLSDLFVIGPVTGNAPPKVAVQEPPEPPLEATPRAKCLSGAHQEPGIQGRVPAGAAVNGLQCNLALVGHQGDAGGFRVWRYVDPAGHECAYYDTALIYPLNALSMTSTSPGVAVVDMTDPIHPVQTATLTELPMLSPHESLNLNARRGLLAAVLGNPATAPGLVSIYSVREDCRHPQLQSTKLVARFGHESGFSPDGKTFYAAGTAAPGVTAIDVTDPKNPKVALNFGERSHGIGVSPDGDRLYLNDAVGGVLTILDSSEIQARKADPKVREISRLTWRSVSIPQNSDPFTVDGHPYLLEFDEFSAASLGGDLNRVGAARIIDIADERHPRVIANLRLQVNQRADHAASLGDPGALSPVQGYASHYCNIDRPVDPVVVACSFISSGLRLFDISDLTRPKEIGYYVQPVRARPENLFMASNFAMSQPQLIDTRREVWYTDATSGLNILRVDPRVWPAPRPASGQACERRRRVVVHVTLPARARVTQIRALLNGKTVKASRQGRHVVITVDLSKFAGRTVRLLVRVRAHGRRTRIVRRTYKPCAISEGARVRDW
jgi:hypothetical protein